MTNHFALATESRVKASLILGLCLLIELDQLLLSDLEVVQTVLTLLSQLNFISIIVRDLDDFSFEWIYLAVLSRVVERLNFPFVDVLNL